MGRKTWILVALALLAVVANPAQASLIGYWELDDADTSAVTATVGPDGTYENPSGFGVQRAPSPGHHPAYSVEFLAAGNPLGRINLGANGGIVSGQAALTMSMWVKLDKLGGDNTFASIGNFGGGAPLIFWRDDDDQGSNRNNTIAVLIGANRTVGQDGILNDSAWHHVAFTYQANAPDGLQLFIDGALTGAAADTTTGAVPGSGSPLVLGNASGNPSAEKELDGLMDQVAIWNEALDPDLIRMLANGAPPENIPEPATVSLLALGGLGLLARRRRRR